MSGARIISDSGLTSVYENAFILALVVGGTLLAIGLARLFVTRPSRSDASQSRAMGISLLYGVFVVAGALLIAVGMALRPLRARAERQDPLRAEPAAAHLTSDKLQAAELETSK